MILVRVSSDGDVGIGPLGGRKIRGCSPDVFFCGSSEEVNGFSR
jgi:hypothetical protein